METIAKLYHVNAEKVKEGVKLRGLVGEVTEARAMLLELGTGKRKVSDLIYT